MSTNDKILRETSPLSIFLVKSGSGGNRLLFRYPYSECLHHDTGSGLLNGQSVIDDEQDRLQFQSVINEHDEALCNMFSVHPNLCGQKFEIKINSVRHVGHPMSLLSTTPITPISNAKRGSDSHPDVVGHHAHFNLDLESYDSLTAPSNRGHKNKYRGDITSFNIVCALRSSASYDIVNCYHDISKRLSIALSFEERRCCYLSREIKTMLTTLEESDMARLKEQHEVRSQNGMKDNFDGEKLNKSKSKSEVGDGKEMEASISDGSVYAVILTRSNLARDLKRIFIDLSTNGVVDLKINNWVSVSFCLPQKVHRLKLMTHKSMPAIGARDIKRCLMYLRPYHGLLLLQEPQDLLDSLPIDASPAFIQLIRVIRPDKNLMELSVDANLTLMQIFNIVAQLIYWAKATIIYPICDSNTYAIHPLASIGLNSTLAADFKSHFPTSKSLHHYLADFSEGTSLSQLNGPLLSIEEKMTLHSIVTWLLQRRILTQIHKYIFLVVERVEKASVQKTTMTPNPREQKESSPQGIEIQFTPNQSHNSQAASGTDNSGGSTDQRNNLYRMSAQAIKNGSSIANDNYSSTNKGSTNSELSLSSSLLDRNRAESFPEFQDDANFGQNSLSSTPNSNLEYPSPGNNDPHIIRGSSLSSSCPLDDPLNGFGGDSILSALQRAGIAQAGIKNILSVPSSKNFDDLRLLIRLMPYFDGKHHVEDIMFFENLERSQVLILCDKFRDILYTCHYEDVAVNQLCPFSG